MAWSALGDRAWLFKAVGKDPRERLARVLELAGRLTEQRIPAVHDIVTSFETLAVHFDPAAGGRVLRWLQSIPPPTGGESPAAGRLIEVPVEYGGACGPDLAAAAATLGMAAEELIRLHGAAQYTVAALGFSPGFPYLTGLPQRLELPRRATPRPVAAGSVAIAGAQAGIYPSASQGGWHVIGRTPLRLFDPDSPAPSLLQAGDRVRFIRGRCEEFSAVRPAPFAAGAIEVLDAGGLDTVQDAGRPGWQHLGVSPGGAADPVMAAVVNRLVGNPDDAAVLECAMRGPRLRCHQAARVAWLGWGDDRAGRPVELHAGAEIDLRGRTRALRGYLAVAGGIDVPRVLGSRATDLRAGFGGFHGRVLRSGDHLPVGRPREGPHAGDWRVIWPRPTPPDSLLELRFLTGVQHAWFPGKTHRALRESIYQISPMSDRMGARLDGAALECDEPAGLISQPVVAGSVQVPPDGRPIVLMAERQTIGGYPQIAHVISADLPILARAWPGSRLRFREVTLDEARDAWRVHQHELALLRTGLAMTARRP
ncbi:MAG: 5-oxoprolinase subunit PxpB [Akkermansiaceae bacterium]|jgi:KipI family sensor histidine kinase inhibitor|nr:5-oxoprolinase subunit PxpB [Akkermansiaceae bacterium]MCU0776132.1 5-oxoprolinase subunit PxpB [Akkermansiaceae bacterium]